MDPKQLQAVPTTGQQTQLEAPSALESYYLQVGKKGFSRFLTMTSSASPTSSIADYNPRQGGSQFSATHSGNLLKLGDGLMNRSWNPRYFLLRGSTLQYFTNAREARAREVIDLLNAEVTWLGEFSGRPFCINIEPLEHRPLQLSGSTLEDAKQWMRWLQEAADPTAYSGLPHAMDSLSPTSSLRQSNRTVEFSIPADLPVLHTSAAQSLENLVISFEGSKRSKLFTLVDVNDGVRILATRAEVEMKKENKVLLFSLIGLLVAVTFKTVMVPLAIFGLLALLVGYFGVPGSLAGDTSTVAGATVSIPISAGGCKNWLMDASKYTLWMPNVSSAFTTAIDSFHDTVHLIFEKSGHQALKRFRWELDDGSICLASAEGTIFEAWFLRRSGLEETKVFYVCSGLGSMSAIERARTAVSGLHQISLQIGDHDGAGIPRPSSSSWSRHFKGGLVPVVPGSSLDSSGLSKYLLKTVLFGRKKYSAKSLFPAAGKSPLQTLPWLFSGLTDTNVIGVRAVCIAFINSMFKAATVMAETAFTTQHPKVGDTSLCWIGSGEKALQVFLEVVEASRPSTGISVSVRLGITGLSWSAKGSVRYTVHADETRKNRAIKIELNRSEIEILASKLVFKISLPDLVVGASPTNRVFWEGVLRVSVESPSSSSSMIMKIPESGFLAGMIMDGNGRRMHTIDGHWLENVWIDNELVWTYGVTGGLQPIVLKKADDSPNTAEGKKPKIPRMSSADEEALIFIKRLRNEIPEIDQKFKQRMDDGYLYRFAKARGFVFDDAKQMLVKHIEWLETAHVTELINFDFPELPEVKAAFPHGYHGVDKMGRAIYISRLAKTDQDRLFRVTDWDRFLKFWIQSYEELIVRKIPVCTANGGRNPQLPGLPAPSALAPLQTLTILDLKGVGLSHINMKVKEFIEKSNTVSSLNYPEILGAMYIVNAPGVFPLMWNAIKGMIDPGTRSKMHVLTAKQTKEKLLEVISPDQLPHFLGGECRCDPNAVESEDSDCGCLSSDKGPWLQQ
jgi:hypothetical protein